MNAPGRLRHEAPIARQREDDDHDHDHDDDTLVEAYLFRNIYKGERGSYNTGSLEHVCVRVCVGRHNATKAISGVKSVFPADVVLASIVASLL